MSGPLADQKTVFVPDERGHDLGDFLLRFHAIVQLLCGISCCSPLFYRIFFCNTRPAPRRAPALCVFWGLRPAVFPWAPGAFSGRAAPVPPSRGQTRQRRRSLRRGRRASAASPSTRAGRYAHAAHCLTDARHGGAPARRFCACTPVKTAPGAQENTRLYFASACSSAVIMSGAPSHITSAISPPGSVRSSAPFATAY